MWTAEFTVEFTPLPEELEEAYWETIRYFAEVMFDPPPTLSHPSTAASTPPLRTNLEEEETAEES